MVTMKNSTWIFIVMAVLLTAVAAKAQTVPIGQWQSHMPYNTCVSIANEGSVIYVATLHSFYSTTIAEGYTEKYSKVNGMSDVGMSKIAYDKYTGSVVLGYQNSNIDIFKDGSFYNIPHLKQKSVSGTKAINHIYTEDGLAYVSTDIGIVVLNLSRNEVKETYSFTRNSTDIPIKAVTSYNGMLYAATTAGLYRIAKSNPGIQAFQEWEAIDSTGNFQTVITSGDKIFLSKQDNVFLLDSDTLRSVYSNPDSTIRNIVPGVNSIWVMHYDENSFKGIAKRLSNEYEFIDSINTFGEANELIDIANPDSTKFIASIYTGLKQRTRKGDPYATIPPDGPGDVGSFDVSLYDKDLLVAHGGYSDRYIPLGNGSGFSVYSNDKWKNYRIFDYQPFGDSVVDFTHIIKGPGGEIYAGSAQSGLFILKPDGSYEYYKQNSFIDPSSTGENLYRISGMTFDNDGVLWLTVFGGTPNELVARTKDGVWHKFSINANRSISHAAANIIVDDYNQKWFCAPSGGGVVVYDDNHTPETPLDDRYIQLQAGEGSGGLPDNEAYCIANDKTGSIWIGTGNGIGIVNCPSQVIQRQCEAEKRVVQFDDFAGYLFQNELVRTIAVDGANRKWIGTNNGIWLVSPNGDEVIERFTIDNSPLPSNIIQKITIDPSTGDVYIGTERGLMRYRGTAVDGGEENSELVTFPNPVPSGYSGSIAIKGFVENADVRITDVSGQLVFRTTALGGQAIWNGMDYTGRRPQSGVYLIFGTNKDGSQTVKGKMVFME